MKKLTKIRLINWHYLANETINVKNNVLLTGPNASGKSTILDAITYVITAGDTQFNLAANEKGKRDLRGYIKCKLGLEDKEYLRDGNVTGDICLEFYDETEDKYFLVGVVMDAFGDLTPVKSLFYLASNTRMNDQYFVSDDNHIYSTVEFRKTNSSFEYFLSKRDAKRGFRTAFGSINEDFFRMIPKALAFKPISDVKEFIYQNILEEKQIDISPIQDSIRSYKNLEETLKVIKAKINDLHDMQELYNQLLSVNEDKKYLSYLLKLFELENYDSKKGDLETQIAIMNERRESKLQEINRQDTYIESLNERSKELYKVLSNNDDFKAEEYVDKQINQVKNELREYDGVEENYLKRASVIKDTINRIRHENDSPLFKEFANVPLSNIDPLMIQNTKQELIKYDKEFQDVINENLISTGKLQSAKDEKVKEMNEVRNAIASLGQNRLNYSPDVLGIRQDIVEGLKRKFNKDISVHIFAELIEIKDKEWARTIEAYLGNRRFDLIVEPTYYDDALEIFARNKGKYRSYGLGLVNTQEMQRFKDYSKNSLAEIMDSINQDARYYINFTCGNVIRCDHEYDLKKYQTSITNDGLIYRGFVVRNMNLNVDRFIGKSALGEQTEYWNSKGNVLKTEYYEINNKLNVLREQNEALRSFDLKSLISSLDKVLRFNELSRQLSELNVKKASIKKLSVSEIEEEYQKTNQLIKQSDAKKMLAVSEIGSIKSTIETFERQIKDLDTNKVLIQKELGELMADNLELEVKAKDEYKDLVAQMAVPRAIDDVNSRMSKCDQNYDNLADGLTNKQMKYINTYASNLALGTSEMPHYLDELNKLEKSTLVEQEEQVRKARETAEIIFKEDFISKLRNNIMTAEAEISKIDDTLKSIKFGRDSYEFIFPKSSQYAAFYDMFKADSISDGRSIFNYDFEQQYNEQLDMLFTSLASDELNSNGAISKFTDYRTYMDYDIKIINEFGESMLYSKVFKEKSGGETQVPFYVAIIASFVRIYSQNKTANRDSIGLVIFDEVFDKMDANRMKSMMDFISTMPLQVIIACPPQRTAILQNYADTILVMMRKNNHASVIPFETNDGYDVGREAN